MTASGGEWLTDTPVVVVAGPAGAGSATVSAAAALGAAERGADVLLVPVGDRPGLASLLAVDVVDDREREVRRTGAGGRLRVRTVPPMEAVADVLDFGGLRGTLRRAATAGALPLIGAAAPGLVDALTLARVADLARRRTADVIVVAAPSGGRAAAFLTAAVNEGPEPGSAPPRAVLERAELAAGMLADPSRSRIVPVATPSPPIVTGARALITMVRTELRATPGPVVINRCRTELVEGAGLDDEPADLVRRAGVAVDPATVAALRSALESVRGLAQRQRELIAELRDESGRAPVLLPALDPPARTVTDLARLADALTPVPTTTIGPT